jgi:hypothetical protein
MKSRTILEKLTSNSERGVPPVAARTTGMAQTGETAASRCDTDTFSTRRNEGRHRWPNAFAKGERVTRGKPDSARWNDVSLGVSRNTCNPAAL